MTDALVVLTDRFNTVGAFWHDAYAEWQVVADPRRCVFEDCRMVGWGETLADAIANLHEKPATAAAPAQ